MNTAAVQARVQRASRQRSPSLGGFVKQFTLMTISLLMSLPLYFIVVNAFKQNQEYGRTPWALPAAPTLQAFETAFDRGDLLVWFGNSVIVTGASVLVVSLLAILTAYALSTMPFPGRALLKRLLVILMLMPPIVMVIPLFVLFINLGLINGYWGAIIVFSGLMLPFSIYLLTSFFDTLPREILEAAIIDGAGRWLVLWRVVVPMSLPAIITQLIVNALYVWNELLIVLIFLQGDKMKTLAAGITVFQGRFFRDTPLVLAASLLVALPMIVAYLIGQRAFIRGLTAGALK